MDKDTVQVIQDEFQDLMRVVQAEAFRTRETLRICVLTLAATQLHSGGTYSAEDAMREVVRLMAAADQQILLR